MRTGRGKVQKEFLLCPLISDEMGEMKYLVPQSSQVVSRLAEHLLARRWSCGLDRGQDGSIGLEGIQSEDGLLRIQIMSDNRADINYLVMFNTAGERAKCTVEITDEPGSLWLDSRRTSFLHAAVAEG
jgi:hypothetical protein